MTEVSGFGAGSMTIDQLGNTREDQDRREASGEDIGLTDTEIIERELVELAWIR